MVYVYKTIERIVTRTRKTWKVRMTNVNIKVARTDFSFGLYSLFSIIEKAFEYSI